LLPLPAPTVYTDAVLPHAKPFNASLISAMYRSPRPKFNHVTPCFL
jgi:hypothetical protein